MTKEKHPEYESEAAMCAEFIAYAEKRGWTAYPETAGFDILLVRKADGFQIGVQAKLRLNAKVLVQSREDLWDAWRGTGPDCRAVLVPSVGTTGLSSLGVYLGITIIVANGPGQMRGDMMWPTGRGYGTWPFRPELPKVSGPSYQCDEVGKEWFDLCPLKRCALPDYVPDVVAGSSAPVQLTEWKIRAIRIAVLLEQRGHVTRADFSALQIDVRRWLTLGWLKPEEGVLKRDAMPDFKAQHPRVYDEIAADIDRWHPSKQPGAQQALAIGAGS